MTRSSKIRRVDATTIASVVITVEGRKAIRDADLATLFGLGLTAFYKRIGRKLWMLRPGWYFKLSKRYARGRLDTQPSLAFAQNGVLLIASILGDDDSLETGMEIVQALRSRRRGSTQKKRPARRKHCAEKSQRYYESMARMLQGRLHDLLRKMQH
ncbi:hypothetical protein [Peristeroidobacter soli]|uniref:hypothetical protein n=1 Tax=Peristeroidobacter soli TaxID=2497877 RepID=UPI00101BC43E|nr:hypothetical protein [Peristeroidobacter soli]